MITPEEQAQLDRLDASEQDFYASLLFLTMRRLLPERDPKEIVDIVLGVYADITFDDPSEAT